MPHDAAEAYTELIRRTREASVLASCGGLLSWDESTYMPRKPPCSLLLLSPIRYFGTGGRISPIHKSRYTKPLAR